MKMRPQTKNLERLTLWLVIGVPAAILVLYGGALKGFPPSAEPVAGPRALDRDRHLLVINGDQDQDFVVFNHQEHRTRMGGEDGCQNCHHLFKPRNHNSACHDCHADMKRPTAIFSHDYHEQKLGEKNACALCHDLSRAKSRQNAKPCADCHARDMGMTQAPEYDSFNFMAPGYQDAMHRLCLECHEKQAAAIGRPGLAACDACHQQVQHQPGELAR